MRPGHPAGAPASPCMRRPVCGRLTAMQPVDEPELTPQLIRDRYQRVLSRLRGVAAEAGRAPDGFRVVAVTKGFGPQVVQAAAAAGLTTFGENRVQEATEKVAAAPDADWHLIGHLQSNKVRPALRLFGTIHSVDSLDLLERIERIAHDDGHRPRLLLQLNVAPGPHRFGFERGWFATQVRAPAGPLAEALAALRHAQVVGLMAMASLDGGDGGDGGGGDPGREGPAAQFAEVRRLRDELQESSGMPLPELSMGMTADADTGVREGATLVRIGTALFGPRPDHHR
jgi:pyridoxal phosphate enzyme (YggS family)